MFLGFVLTEYSIGILNLTHIVDCLGASAVAIASHGVVVELGMSFPQQRLFHIRVPHLGVLLVLLCKFHCIGNVSHASIVGSQGEAQALGVVGDVALQELVGL